MDEKQLTKTELDSLPAQIVQLKKDKLVRSYKDTDGNISAACKITSVSRDTYYRWLEEDEKFAMQIFDAEAGLNDEMRQELINQAKHRKNIAAVIFYLKSRHPDFKEIKETGGTTVNVQINTYNL